MEDKPVFTYGSLMYEAVWGQLVQGMYRSEMATLNGFIRCGVIGEEYPVVYAGQRDDSVLGRLYWDVSGADQQALDRFEGEYYQRVSHPVMTTTAGEVMADVYVLKSEFHAISDARPWDVEAFERSGLQRFLARYKGFR